ncbi:cmcH, partial [Symbiodinium pilosum]
GPAWSEGSALGRNESSPLPEKPIIAVIRGRQEFGPRALGHRSLLAVPDSDEIRVRMNRLKVRQWYRPVAPMIAAEDLVKVFGREVPSPYMTMAPRVLDHIREQFPALAHLDGTARHQSVGKSDEPWLNALLLAVGRRTGLAALINTSFNTKGHPIVNSVRESLKLLDDLPDLDFVLIEDWLFHKRRRF